MKANVNFRNVINKVRHIVLSFTLLSLSACSIKISHNNEFANMCFSKAIYRNKFYKDIRKTQYNIFDWPDGQHRIIEEYMIKGYLRFYDTRVNDCINGKVTKL